MTAPDTPPALFEPPARPAGPLRTAMLENFDQWHRAGTVLSPVMRAALLAQADAVDLGLAGGKATNVSGASRVLLELLQGFGLVTDVVPPSETTETAAGFIAKVEEWANSADD